MLYSQLVFGHWLNSEPDQGTRFQIRGELTWHTSFFCCSFHGGRSYCSHPSYDQTFFRFFVTISEINLKGITWGRKWLQVSGQCDRNTNFLRTYRFRPFGPSKFHVLLWPRPRETRTLCQCTYVITTTTWQTRVQKIYRKSLGFGTFARLYNVHIRPFMTYACDVIFVQWAKWRPECRCLLLRPCVPLDPETLCPICPGNELVVQEFFYPWKLKNIRLHSVQRFR